MIQWFDGLHAKLTARSSEHTTTTTSTASTDDVVTPQNRIAATILIRIVIVDASCCGALDGSSNNQWNELILTGHVGGLSLLCSL